MTEFTKEIMSIEQKYQQSVDLKAKIDNLYDQLEKMNERYAVMLEAQSLLTTVSDENTSSVLDYITGVINKTLAEMFPHDSRRVSIERSIYQGKSAHINIRLSGSNGKPRDLMLQSGTGLRQVISFLYILTLVEIRKGRRIILADELLNGLHPEAKRVVCDIIKIFAEEGYQFAFVEYGIDNLGKIYLVEKPGETATISPLDGVYNNEVFVFNRPPEDVDMSLRVEE